MQVNQSTDYKIISLYITTRKGDKIDIKNFFNELNIFDTIFMSSVSGHVFINDAVGMLHKLKFNGSEAISIEIGKDENNLIYKNKFRIYKVTDRKNVNQTSEIYLLHFISDEYIFSLQQKINQWYVGTYDKIAARIAKDYLDLNQINGDQSFGIKNFIVPNLNPIEALTWMSKRAVDRNNQPNFLFFQNRLGYNFVSLIELLKQPVVAKINFNPKNLSGDINKNSTSTEFLGARDFKTINQFDFIETINSGSYAGRFQGFDPITRSLTYYDYDYVKMLSPDKIALGDVKSTVVIAKDKSRNTENYETRKVLSPFESFREKSEYIKKRTATIDYNGQKLLPDNPEYYLLQRRSILKKFLDTRVRVVVPGNFNLSAGMNVNLRVPKRGFIENPTNAEDPTLDVNYMIVSTRHIITAVKHETIFEACTDFTSIKDNSESVAPTAEIESPIYA